MGCNCGKKRQKPQPEKQESFQLQLDTGETFVYGSRLEAEAARVRSNRWGVIRAVK